jgi:rhamnose utilization protein RhaD (predicted bifunctional aldolase and dehydrogenase)
VENLWRAAEADRCEDTVSLRVYSSNLLGADDDLVLHGGGNTSVKVDEEGETILYVKGSGWDLASIKPEGFAPVRMAPLLAMAEQEELSDTEMVAQQRAAMTDPSAPNPSVEAILHALIPFRYVDHTHADAIVTLSNSAQGDAILSELFPDFLIVPYVMPGFELARTIRTLTQGMVWSECGGIILHHHGIFTFDHEAENAYRKMIEAVNRAEAYLDAYAPMEFSAGLDDAEAPDLDTLRERIADAKKSEIVLKTNTSPMVRAYASQKDLVSRVTRGVLTPEHILRTKRVPLVLRRGADMEQAIQQYMEEYRACFGRYAAGEVMLNPAPNYAVIEGYGTVSFGRNDTEAAIIDDIVTHTVRAVLRADRLGGYRSIDEAESFAMEYWELEQAKLKKG